jgi:hypothetical protein
LLTPEHVRVVPAEVDQDGLQDVDRSLTFDQDAVAEVVDQVLDERLLAGKVVKERYSDDCAQQNWLGSDWTGR